jgi:hypothetical protein
MLAHLAATGRYRILHRLKPRQVAGICLRLPSPFRRSEPLCAAPSSYRDVSVESKVPLKTSGGALCYKVIDTPICRELLRRSPAARYEQLRP